MHRNSGLPHHWVIGEDRLDLPQLDPESSDLDLRIEPLHIIEGAIGSPETAITGSVKNRMMLSCRTLRPVGVEHEAVSGVLLILPVSEPDTDTGYADFSGDTDRYEVQLCIEHIVGHVRDRRADRYRAAIGGQLGRQNMLARIICRLGGAIGIHHTHIGVGVQPQVDDGHRNGLSRHHGPFQIGQGALRRRQCSGMGQQFLQQHRHQLDQRDPFRLDQPEKLHGVADGLVVGDDRTTSLEQRTEKLPDRDVRGCRGTLEKGRVGVEFEQIEFCEDVIHGAIMAYHRPARRAGGAGGVQHVGRIARGADTIRIVGRTVAQPLGIEQDELEGAVPLCRPLVVFEEVRPSDQMVDLAVLEHVTNPVFRILSLHRDERATGFENAEHGGEEINSPRLQDRHELVRLQILRA